MFVYTQDVPIDLETYGKVLDSGEKVVSVAPSGVTCVESRDFSRFLGHDTRRELVFVAELWQGTPAETAPVARQTAFLSSSNKVSLRHGRG